MFATAVYSRVTSSGSPSARFASTVSNPFVVLQRVRGDLVREPDPAPLLVQVDDHPVVLLDVLHRQLQLLLAVALQRAEDLGREARVVHADWARPRAPRCRRTRSRPAPWAPRRPRSGGTRGGGRTHDLGRELRLRDERRLPARRLVEGLRVHAGGAVVRVVRAHDRARRRRRGARRRRRRRRSAIPTRSRRHDTMAMLRRRRRGARHRVHLARRVDAVRSRGSRPRSVTRRVSPSRRATLDCVRPRALVRRARRASRVFYLHGARVHCVRAAVLAR